jgi:hypothetical protein
MNYFEVLYRGCDAKAIWIQRILGAGHITRSGFGGAGGHIRTAARTKSWSRHDREGQIDAAESRRELPLARRVHS